MGAVINLAEVRAKLQQQAEKGGIHHVIAGFETVLQAEADSARHLFVVCGEPSTEEGFHAAWQKEDPKWFESYMNMKQRLAAMKAGLK